jgi:hypothetical protein
MAGQGTLILALDYNNIQSKISQVLGVGSSNYGYNQTVLSSQVSVNQKITAIQWQNLYNDLIRARGHQTGANESTSITYPTTSLTIKEIDRAAYQTYVNTIDANRLSVPPSGQATLETYATGTRTQQWNGTITHTVVLTFTDGNTARSFFNAGGYIQLSASETPDVSNLKNNSWQTMLANMGFIRMTYNSTTNTGNNNGVTTSNVGYLSLTTTPQLAFVKLTEQPTYSSNQYNVFVNTDATGSIITFSIQFADLSGGGVDENVTGTLISLVQGYRPSGSNVSISTPSVSSSGP